MQGASSAGAAQVVSVPLDRPCRESAGGPPQGLASSGLTLIPANLAARRKQSVSEAHCSGKGGSLQFKVECNAISITPEQGGGKARSGIPHFQVSPARGDCLRRSKAHSLSASLPGRSRSAGIRSRSPPLAPSRPPRARACPHPVVTRRSPRFSRPLA